MIFDVLSFLLLFASLGGIVVIVGKRYALLASIDVEAIPAERDAIVKERIMTQRIKRKISNWLSFVAILLKPAHASFQSLNRIMSRLHQWLFSVRMQYKKVITIGGATLQSTKALSPATPLSPIEQLSLHASEALREQQYANAEQAYIDILALDEKNVSAFQGLSTLYTEQKDWEKAKQTFSCVRKLIREILRTTMSDEERSMREVQYAETLFNLSEVHRALGNMKTSLTSLKGALELQGNNPRYLNELVEVYYLMNQRLKAEQAIDKLEKINPENQKISQLRKMAASLEY